jgi:ribosomal protein S18 acetylase RimI-like enzyme
VRRLALILPVLLLPLAGCSGDDGESLEERRSAYLQSAEAVCADSNEQVEALGQPTSVAEVPTAADRAVEIVRGTVASVEALEPPEEDRAEIEEKVVDPLRADVGVAEQYAEEVKAAAAANDSLALLRLLGERPQTTADLEFMRGYGFVECVRAADQRT